MKSKGAIFFFLLIFITYITNTFGQLPCTISTDMSNFSQSASSQIGQSFTACQTGTFGAISVWGGILSSDGQNVTLTIHQGESTSNPIYTQYIGSLPSVSFFNSLRVITLTTPVNVVSGEKYTFSFTGDLTLVTFQQPGSVYSGGRLCIQNTFDSAGEDFTFEINIDSNNGCENEVTISQNVTGNYSASAILSTTGNVEVSGTTNFKAGQSVTLNPGFVTAPATVFLAIIGSCP